MVEAEWTRLPADGASEAENRTGLPGCFRTFPSLHSALRSLLTFARSSPNRFANSPALIPSGEFISFNFLNIKSFRFMASPLRPLLILQAFRLLFL
jgi:hypothetical protein